MSFNAQLMFGLPRSGRWPTTRLDHLKTNPTCAACGGKTKIQVHHIVPYWKKSELELDPNNLISLCEGSGKCHFVHGHLLDWKSYNPQVKSDAKNYLQRVVLRPKWEPQKTP